jgi:hypothetical protein
MTQPSLTEPGTKYFLSSTLKKCNMKRNKLHTFYLNVLLLFIFSMTVVLFLVYKFKNKPTMVDKQYKKKQKEMYILSKVRNVIERKEREQTNSLTNLPKFKNDYKLLHEKYYKI